MRPDRLKMMILASAGTLVSSSGAFAYTGTASAASTPVMSCSIAGIQKVAPVDTTITSAQPTVAPVPHCRIEGYVTTTNPGPNKVLFRLQLPDRGWTGRYYFIGMGAAAGYVPSDSQIPAGNPLYKGFAVAGTDTGHEGPMADWSFMGRNKAQAVDHIDRGAHVTAVATQQITKAYYNSAVLHRYHSGCSGGGRMGVMAIERHPEDFDGVLLGAPGGRSNMTMVKFIIASQEMMREPGAWLSPAKLQMVEDKVTAACDKIDGARDGIVADHRRCNFDVAKLQCKSGDGPGCLTGPEIRSIKAVLRGPLGPDGRSLTQGMPITNMSVWSAFLGKTPPPWSNDPNEVMKGNTSAGYVIGNSMGQALFGQNYDAVKQFNSRDRANLDAWRVASLRLDFGEPYTANLADFQKSGGKVLFWNGVSDPCCSDVELEQYYRDSAKFVSGGMSALPAFMRYYRVPGMAHCGGGTGPGDAPDELLDALIAWVEQGKAPGDVVAHRGVDREKLQFADPKTKVVSGVLVPPPSGQSRDFLLCPFPKTAVFNGSKAPGAVNDAANWSCKGGPAGALASR